MKNRKPWIRWTGKKDDGSAVANPDRPREDSSMSRDALRALDRARSALASTHDQTQAVREIASSLRDLRDRNHFGESIEISMMRRARKDNS